MRIPGFIGLAPRVALLSLSTLTGVAATGRSASTECCEGDPTTITGDGASVYIPEGVMYPDVEIRVEAVEPPTAIPEAYEQVGNVYRFTPHGLLFSGPVTITLPHTAGSTEGLAVLSLPDADDTSWAPVTGCQYEDYTVACATLSFSYYVPGTGCDGDGDGWSLVEGDCDDTDDSVHPGADEVPCDGVDNDCDPATPDEPADDGGDIAMTNVTIAGNRAGTGVFWPALTISKSTASMVNVAVVMSERVGVGGGGGSASFSHSNVWGSCLQDFDGMTDPTGTDGNVSEEPQYLDYSWDPSDCPGWDPVIDDLHLTAVSPQLDAGDPSILDPDGSPSDIGHLGGPGAGDWDLDLDGYPQWWQPGPYDHATYPALGWDCDDRDPTVYPGSGC